VVDASVVSKWVLSGENYEENAAKLKAEYVAGNVDLSAPSFMVQEVTNSIWKAIKQKRITLETAQSALENLDALQINLYCINWMEACEELAIATKNDLTVYDAAYLFLAEKMNAQVITADDKMCQKGKGQFRLLHLKDYV
jgi:predicted nucleic acid-binding protein